jgi:hypothetical protein
MVMTERNKSLETRLRRLAEKEGLRILKSRLRPGAQLIWVCIN